jgi:hypothetical protein
MDVRAVADGRPLHEQTWVLSCRNPSRNNSEQCHQLVWQHLLVALIPPKVRQLVKPSPEDAALRAHQWEVERAERDRMRALERPRRREVLELGPQLRSLDAAVDCQCGCHPRPAQIETHDGGTSCPCQLTKAERRKALAEFFDSNWELDPEVTEQLRVRSEAFKREANRLNAQAEVRVEAAPFVISGIVDGRAFYMRERSGRYRVTIATDDDPLNDPWNSDPEVPTIDIAAGSEAEFYDTDGVFRQDRALAITIDCIRSHFLRRDCEHEPPSEAAHRFCRKCGVDLH